MWEEKEPGEAWEAEEGMSTGISYLDEVWNPVTGCSGKGCKAHCWARYNVETMKRHVIHGWDDSMEPVPFSTVQFHPERLDKPLHWRKPRRIGVVFCGDLFDEQLNEYGGWDHTWDVFRVMIKANWHTYFLLTKQPQNMAVFYKRWIKDPLPHVWHGVSITDQEDADRMIPELLKVPGKHWLSIEPMLGSIPFLRLTRIHWVVIGAESGPKRRPCDHQWMVDVVRQCKAAGVPCYVKQYPFRGKVSHNPDEWPEELRVRQLP